MDEVETAEVAPREPEAAEKVQNGAVPTAAAGKAKGKKYSRLAQLRRRRHARQKADESDLSEGFDSDPSDESAKESERSDSGSERSDEDEAEDEEDDEDDEEAEAAFDLESESDMNSQESRSDLEDMVVVVEEEPAGGRHSESGPGPWGCQARAPDAPPEPALTNGPTNDCDSAIASNLQALSSQMFQAKRCFRLAPTFSNVVSRPPLPPGDGAPVASHPDKPCANGVIQTPGAPDH
ncbi:hypothetical protein chiPu_0027266, partial [Chiloscyllium punctatum]|nr:hypothetical protein [Chiloscyllium punctatum]